MGKINKISSLASWNIRYSRRDKCISHIRRSENESNFWVWTDWTYSLLFHETAQFESEHTFMQRCKPQGWSPASRMRTTKHRRLASRWCIDIGTTRQRRKHPSLHHKALKAQDKEVPSRCQGGEAGKRRLRSS